jgi:hypothetical protein
MECAYCGIPDGSAVACPQCNEFMYCSQWCAEMHATAHEDDCRRKRQRSEEPDVREPSEEVASQIGFVVNVCEEGVWLMSHVLQPTVGAPEMTVEELRQLAGRTFVAVDMLKLEDYMRRCYDFGVIKGTSLNVRNYTVPDEIPNEDDDIEIDRQDPYCCAVCMVRRIKTAVVPCGHQIMCVTCAREFRANQTDTSSLCPLCRAPVESIVKLFPINA